MTRQRRWVFESRVPLEDFRRRVRMVLRSRGFEIGDAKVFDLKAKRDWDRVFVALRYHNRGIEAVVKVKPSILGDPDPIHEEVFRLLRHAQLDLAERGSERVEQRRETTDRPAETRPGDAPRAKADQGEDDGDGEHRGG